MKLSQKQIDSVLALSGQRRYEHFVKVVVDCDQMWGLYQDGWALAETEKGQKVFLLWPACEYAKLCAKGEWSGFEPESITVKELMDELLPKLKADGMLPGVFCAPTSRGVTPTVEQLMADIRAELGKY